MPLDTRQQKWLPLGLNPQACVQDTASESSRPGIPFPDHRFRYLQPPFQALLSSYDQQSCGKQVSSCLNGRRSSCDAAASPEGALKSSRKRFLVFDQSGNQTRLLQCGFPLQFPPSMDAEQGRILDSLNQEKGFSKGNAIPDKMLLRDDHVNGEEEEEEESEMHEDTEEINALLYSDDEDNDDCESDDDVMSTGHSPFQQACNNTTREELDETESSDDGPRRKRQKLLDQSYKDQSPSLVGTITKLKGLSDEKLHDTNISSNKQQETGSVLSEEQSRKDKIHTALRILESVVPGAKGKEALLLLDEAIDYLKLLKRNLNSSKEGLNYNHW